MDLLSSGGSILINNLLYKVGLSNVCWPANTRPCLSENVEIPRDKSLHHF